MSWMHYYGHKKRKWNIIQDNSICTVSAALSYSIGTCKQWMTQAPVFGLHLSGVFCACSNKLGWNHHHNVCCQPEKNLWLIPAKLYKRLLKKCAKAPAITICTIPLSYYKKLLNEINMKSLRILCGLAHLWQKDSCQLRSTIWATNVQGINAK